MHDLPRNKKDFHCKGKFKRGEGAGPWGGEPWGWGGEFDPGEGQTAPNPLPPQPGASRALLSGPRRGTEAGSGEGLFPHPSSPPMTNAQQFGHHQCSTTQVRGHSITTAPHWGTLPSSWTKKERQCVMISCCPCFRSSLS